MEKKTIQQGFNNHFKEMMDAVEAVLPGDLDVKAAKNSITSLIKINPKIVIDVWYRRVATTYKDKISKGDISFFLEKDYSHEVDAGDKTDAVMEGLNRLRGPVINLGNENHGKVMKYMQNLSKLSELYFMH